MTKKLMIVLWTLIYLFSTFNYSLAESPSFVRILSVKGDVFVKKNGGKREIPAFRAMRIYENDSIRTAANSSVTLEIAINGKVDEKASKITLAPHTLVSISQLTFKEQQEQSSLKLWAGTIWNAVKSLADSSGQYHVETNTALMGVKGTLFLAQYNPQLEQLKTEVFDGRVEIAKKSNTTDSYVAPFSEELTINNAIEISPNQENLNITELKLEQFIKQNDATIITEAFDHFVKLTDDTKKELSALPNFYAPQTNTLIDSSSQIEQSLNLLNKAVEIESIATQLDDQINRSPSKPELLKELKLRNLDSTLLKKKSDSLVDPNQVVSVINQVYVANESINQEFSALSKQLQPLVAEESIAQFSVAFAVADQSFSNEEKFKKVLNKLTRSPKYKEITSNYQKKYKKPLPNIKSDDHIAVRPEALSTLVQSAYSLSDPDFITTPSTSPMMMSKGINSVAASPYASTTSSLSIGTQKEVIDQLISQQKNQYHSLKALSQKTLTTLRSIKNPKVKKQLLDQLNKKGLNASKIETQIKERSNQLEKKFKANQVKLENSKETLPNPKNLPRQQQQSKRESKAIFQQPKR